VGFIRKLPHHLVASFRSTLEEVREADVLLHVVDASHPLLEEQIAVVNETLEDIGAGGKRTIMVFNKIDRLQDRSELAQLRKTFDQPVFISATRSINVTGLVARLTNVLDAGITEATLQLAQQDYALISRIHDLADVLDTVYNHDSVTVRFRAPTATVEHIRKLIERGREKGEGS
jgi:GTP-binding protein HflX